MAEPELGLKRARFRVIFVEGPQKRVRELAYAIRVLPSRVCLVKAASDHTRPGFKEIVSPQYGPLHGPEPDVYADGVLLSDRFSAAIIPTADCPVLVIYEYFSRRLVVAHAGRSAMTPEVGSDGEIHNIVTSAIAAVSEGVSEPAYIAYITPSICGECFVHETKEAQKLIEPFDVFGEAAFYDREQGALDLQRLIIHQLVTLGVDRDEIFYDGICTLEEERFFSYRRDRTADRNTTVAVLY